MDRFREALLEKARKEADALLSEAKKFRARKLREATKQAELLVRELKEKYTDRLEAAKRAESVRARVELENRKLLRRKEVFERLKELVKEELRSNPAGLARFALKGKGTVVRAPKAYKKHLKGFRGKFVEADIDGLEVGDGKVWHVAEVSELVEDYFERHYPELFDKVFG